MKKISIYILALMTALLCGCVTIPSKPAEYSDTKVMMDTVCTVKAGGGNAKSAVELAFSRIDEISKKVDYYSENSELDIINKSAANTAIKLSDDLYNIIEASLEISEASGGAFDITIAPLIDLWNISGGAHTPPSNSEIAAVKAHIGYENIVLDKQNKTLTKKYDDVKIDLGGVAKGYAADCAIQIMKESNVGYALIDLGGNISTFGKNPSKNDGKWTVGIQKPFSQSGEYSQTVSIDEGSVVTAGTYQRYFTWEGKNYHHIIDPETGYPSDSGLESASITADSAMLADCISTAVVVLGEEQGGLLADKFGVELIVN